MKELQISLDVYSKSRTLRELLESLDIAEASDGSHDLSDHRPDGRPWTSTRLRLDSGLEGTAPIESHIDALASKVRTLPSVDDVEIFVTVAVFFDSPMASLQIPIASLSRFALPNWQLEVVSYPSIGC